MLLIRIIVILIIYFFIIFDVLLLHLVVLYNNCFIAVAPFINYIYIYISCTVVKFAS